jgi:hypothetical protein
MITIGQQTAAILSFIAIMFLLEPVLILVMPHAVAMQYFGKNTGIVNQTYYLFAKSPNGFQVPVLNQANSSSGFGASAGLTQFGGLAFIYGALNLFWVSLLQFPGFIYTIFTGLSNNILFIPASITIIASIICFSYVVIGDFYILLSMWMKSDAANVGQ